MAVTEAKNPSSLRIKLDLGMVDGRTKVRSKTFSSYIKNSRAPSFWIKWPDDGGNVLHA